MSNVLHPNFARILRPWAPPSASLHRQANMAREEMEHFNAAVRRAELAIQMAMSSLLIDCGNDTDGLRAIVQERIGELLIDAAGERWADLRRRLDDAGVDPGVRRFPTAADNE